MKTFAEDIRATYAEHPAGISLQHAPFDPFIGRAFREPSMGDLRIVALGVNAYVDDHAWSTGLPAPTLLSTWFEKEMWSFQRRVAKDVSLLGEELVRRAPYFADRTWRGKDGVYLTNFVKSYVRTSIGKREDQLSDHDIAGYVGAWEQELDAMATHDVLPHVVIVYSRRIWDHAWRAFYRPPADRALKVRDYLPLREEPEHRLNRLVVSGPSTQEQTLLLLRLRHPSAPDKTASPEWLLSHGSVQRFLDLGPRG